LQCNDLHVEPLDLLKSLPRYCPIFCPIFCPVTSAQLRRRTIWRRWIPIGPFGNPTGRRQTPRRTLDHDQHRTLVGRDGSSRPPPPVFGGDAHVSLGVTPSECAAETHPRNHA
jgi:hypothetical protein